MNIRDLNEKQVTMRRGVKACKKLGHFSLGRLIQSEKRVVDRDLAKALKENRRV